MKPPAVLKHPGGVATLGKEDDMKTVALCRVCGNWFLTKVNGDICSNACRKSLQVTFPCERCARPITCKASRVGRKRFCSRTCKDATVVKTCRQCGAPFDVALCLVAALHCCSRACSTAFRTAAARPSMQPPEPVPGCSWIVLARGEFALVDDADVPLVSGAAWHASKAGKTRYASAHVRRDGAWRGVSMHRLIMGEPGAEVDHVNMNGLDNRRINLRLATKSEQRCNQRHISPHGYKGVALVRGGWIAQVVKHKIRRATRPLPTVEDAARAHDDLAREMHGEFARLNFPREGEQSAR